MGNVPFPFSVYALSGEAFDFDPRLALDSNMYPGEYSRVFFLSSKIRFT